MQVYHWQAGERLASVAIRRLRRHSQRELGSAPALLYAAGRYGVFTLEEVLDVLGSAPRESLLPALAQPSAPDSPTSFLISKYLGGMGELGLMHSRDLVFKQREPPRTDRTDKRTPAAFIPLLFLIPWGSWFGALLYLSVSLLVAGLSSSGGCEVVALPSLLFPRDAQRAGSKQVLE